MLVHGGGPAINEMLKKVGVESHFAGGLRVTDDATMEVVQQVLAGKVNKDLVAKLRGRGVGLCGMDGQMLRCAQLDPQLGHVGEVIHVDTTLIQSLLDGGYIPVIATVGMDDLGQAYNINADTAAARIAVALQAEKLVSMTDIAGLLRDKEDESTLIPEVEVSEIQGYQAAGIIAGGMIPKIGGMADAIYQGVREAVIIDGRVPHSILLEMFSDRGSGTLSLPPHPGVGSLLRPGGCREYTGAIPFTASSICQQEVRSLWTARKSSSGTKTASCPPTTATLSCWKKGHGLYAEGPEGQSYLDFTSGIGVNTLGYCDLAWAEAVSKQAHKLQHASNLYYTAPCGKLAKRLCQRTGMSRVFFANSGAEANEGAIKPPANTALTTTAATVTKIITLVNSFHGRTLATLTATGQGTFHQYFGPFNEGFHQHPGRRHRGPDRAGGPAHLRYPAGACPGRGRRDGAGPGVCPGRAPAV